MFQLIIIKPLYNTLVFLAAVIPGNNIGLAIIILTVVVRIILIPLQNKTIATQKKLKKLEPEIKKIKEKTKNDKRAEAAAIMALYKENKVNPFSGFSLILVQIPVFIGLYLVLRNGLSFDPDNIYSFVSFPEKISNMFAGLNLSEKSYLLAAVLGVSQFIHTNMSISSPVRKEGDKRSFSDELNHSLHFQMKYVMPVIFAFVAASLPSAVSLYWLTSSLFSILYELFMKRMA